MMINLHKYTALKFARTLAEKCDLNVVFEEENQPRTDGRTLYVQNPRDDWDEDAWAIWWGSLYHEIGHNDKAMRDCFTLVEDKKIDMSSFFGAGVNILDDNRQERWRWDEYAGRRTYLSKAHSLITKSIVDKGAFGNPENDDHRNAIEAVLCWDAYDREYWMEGMVGLGKEVYNTLRPQAQGWVDDLLRSRFVLEDLTTAESEYTMWKGIIDEIFKFNSDEEEKQAQESYESKQGEGDGQAGEDSGGKGKSGKGSDDGEGKGAEAAGVVDYSDVLKHEHTNDRRQSTYAPMHINYDTTSSGIGFNSQPVKTIDYYKGTVPCSSAGHYAEGISRVVNHSGSLGATVRRLLQIKSKDRYQYGKKSGKLHGSSLYRLGIKDGGGVSSRVFKQKKINTCLDVSFTVLGDASGSMGGDKYINMGGSMIMLNDAIAPLGIPYELLAFTDVSRTEISVFKTFTSKVSSTKLLTYLEDCSHTMSNNADGEAILWAYHRLAAQKTKRKVLVVLSDGSPATHRGDADSHTKMVIDNIQKRGEVEIYGIGIEDDNVRRLYKDWKVIDDSSELESALLDLIKTKIIN